MKSKSKRRIRAVFLILIIVYFTGGVVLYFIQDLILFHPQTLSKEYPFSFDEPFEEMNIPFEGQNISIIKFKPAEESRGTVLFYHGNMKNVERYKKYPGFFLRNHYEIWMIDYPGFGKSTGKRTEDLINREALVMYDLALKHTSSDSMVIYGKSIGTGVASYVAASKNCKRLILETPYYSIPALAQHYFPIYPVAALIKYSFPVHDYLNKTNIPVSIFHGTGDEVVPYAQSLRLKKENPNIELITIEKGRHNDLAGFAVFQRKLDSLLSY